MSYGSIRNPPKYSCSVCNKLFRRRKQKDDHKLFNRCRGMRGGTNKKQATEPTVEQELVSMKDEFVHYEPQTIIYYGREYAGNPIPSGNRHLRSGLPLPRLSKYKRAAI